MQLPSLLDSEEHVEEGSIPGEEGAPELLDATFQRGSEGCPGPGTGQHKALQAPPSY